MDETGPFMPSQHVGKGWWLTRALGVGVEVVGKEGRKEGVINGIMRGRG